MNWKHYFTTSVGRKLVMGFTGLFLVLFLLVHCYVNSMIFISRNAFNAAADFMGTTVAIRIMEIGLFAGIILHIIQGLMLARMNKAKRSIGYATNTTNTKQVPWYSRSMTLLGTLVMLFLIMHISHFWVPSRITHDLNATKLPNGVETHDLFQKMLDVFQSPIVVVLYLIGVASLAFHLFHGFFSACQTMGLTSHKYKNFLKGFGIVFSVIVCLLFAAMPISMYMGWVA
ncbi:MAG: succinate dehydrogenase cytochrome b subunit [Bacteroidetes bacterium]|nr:succinate dehydrogenase cytochrome b subunit [Bacteroidota bacterium]